jgi:hypothetical protein
MPRHCGVESHASPLKTVHYTLEDATPLRGGVSRSQLKTVHYTLEDATALRRGVSRWLLTPAIDSLAKR